MRYLELIITVEKEKLEAVENALENAGFEEMIINDPADYLEIEEHPEWYKYDYINEELAKKSEKNPEITIYFSDDEEGAQEVGRAEDVLRELSESRPDALKWTLSVTGDDSEWLYKWQEHFKPTNVGERFVVKPSWEEYDAEEGELVIEMDPGMAFGSGLHETTTLCIKALEQIAADSGKDAADNDTATKEKDEKGLSGLGVLDVGTGTGILAIAASMLGARSCLGIDIDADAVRIAEENVERNGLSDRIELGEGDLMEGVDFDADIIVANLMADLVIRLAPAAAEQLKPGGIFISSGILDIKEEVVTRAVRKAGFEIEEVLHDGEWCAVIARRI